MAMEANRFKLNDLHFLEAEQHRKGILNDADGPTMSLKTNRLIMGILPDATISVKIHDFTLA